MLKCLWFFFRSVVCKSIMDKSKKNVVEKERAANWEKEEKEVLLQLGKRHADLLSKAFSNSLYNDQKLEVWKKITAAVNEKGRHNRTWEQVLYYMYNHCWWRIGGITNGLLHTQIERALC